MKSNKTIESRIHRGDVAIHVCHSLMSPSHVASAMPLEHRFSWTHWDFSETQSQQHRKHIPSVTESSESHAFHLD